MKTIIENYREFLTEAAFGPQEFLENNLVAYMENKPGQDAVGFYITKKGAYRNIAEIEINYLPTANPGINPDLAMHRRNTFGTCLKGWQVTWSESAVKGWGPFMYDIAMEYASQNGIGLTCDRAVVSKDAYKVWNYYLNNRPDVRAFQLDDLKNTLTPTEMDNCIQDAPEYSKKYGGQQPWPNSPLSKVYRKNNTNVTDFLESHDRFKTSVQYDAMDYADYDYGGEW